MSFASNARRAAAARAERAKAEADGERAHMSAQFVVFEVRAASRPAAGWPENAFGAQGTVRSVESGYYDTDRRRADGEWKIVAHRVLMDMPMAIPGA
ncbi:hypothetical protein ACIBO9_01045 [Streptomyces prunicolor]|uniref:hypothetical protein n=1 Tax=Streptomyces prunicolor TaxID=67348 RepID=UPI0037D121C7